MAKSNKENKTEKKDKIDECPLCDKALKDYLALPTNKLNVNNSEDVARVKAVLKQIGLKRFKKAFLGE